MTIILFPRPVLASLTPPSACRVCMACRSGYAQKVPLADLDAIVTKNAVGGRGVEIEVRKCNAVEKFLTLQSQGSVGARRESDVTAVRAFELRGREFLE